MERPMFPPLSTMREHVAFLRFCKKFNDTCEDGSTIRPVWDTLTSMIVIPIVCAVRGHQWECMADVENGTEEIWCERCGFGMRAQF